MKYPFLLSYQNWSFKKKLLAIISALIIAIVILISFSSYIMYSKNFTRQTVNQTQQIIEQVSLNVDTYMDELFRLNLSPYYNDDIMEELEEEYTTKLSNLNKKRRIENFLSSVMILPRSEILRVYILTDTNLYSYTRTPYDMEDYDSYRSSSWYQEALTSSTPIFVPTHSEKVFGDKPTQIFSIAQRIRSKEDNSKVLAVIKVDADYSGIKTICDQVQMQEKGSLLLVDQDNSIIYQNNHLGNETILAAFPTSEYTEDGSYSKLIHHQKYILNIASLKNTNWKVIAVNSDKELNKAAKTIRNMTILMALFCMLFALSLMFVLIQNFLKPLFHMVHLMKQVQDGDLTVRVDIQNNDEIGYLGRSFNQMILRITEILDKNTQLVKEIYESRYLQKEAQYNILCSQIKPHFLYNTLNTISLLIKCKDTAGAIQSIEKLSFFLRGIVNADKIIPLAKELEIVDSYLGIQKARYGDNLNYEIFLSSTYDNYHIPALTLQPIVENAIIHGCEVKRGQSMIRIYDTTEDDFFLIHIDDNGAGMEEEKLTVLNEALASVHSNAESPSNPDTMTESIGLINVNKRIKLKYGDAYGLTITSIVSEGTQVIIKLPNLQNKEAERSPADVPHPDC